MGWNGSFCTPSVGHACGTRRRRVMRAGWHFPLTGRPLALCGLVDGAARMSRTIWTRPTRSHLTSRMRKECHGELGNAVDASCCATCVPAAFRNPKAPRFLLRVMGSGICSLFVLLCVGLGSFDASSELAKKKLLRCGLVALCLFQKQSSNQDGRSRTCTKLVRKKMWTDLHGTYGHVTDNFNKLRKPVRQTNILFSVANEFVNFC
jgi:hypothetical protein